MHVQPSRLTEHSFLQQLNSSLTNHKCLLASEGIISMVSRMHKKPRRHFLKEREVRNLLLESSQRLKTDVEQLLGSKPRVEVNETETAEIFIINGKPVVARSKGELFPILTFEKIFSVLAKIVVDMGAVPHICKGADVMAPGVVGISGEFDVKDFLLLVDERHGKPLAVGIALFNSQATKNVRQGKIVKNIHHVGGKLWKELQARYTFQSPSY